MYLHSIKAFLHIHKAPNSKKLFPEKINYPARYSLQNPNEIMKKRK